MYSFSIFGESVQCMESVLDHSQPVSLSEPAGNVVIPCVSVLSCEFRVGLDVLACPVSSSASSAAKGFNSCGIQVLYTILALT